MKHLTFDDRLNIQKGLKNNRNFAQIADEIGKDRSTVSREVKRHRIYIPHESGNICVNRKTCNAIELCAGRKPSCWNLHKCRSSCGICNQSCRDFKAERCVLTNKPPYVCNGCTDRCHLGKWRYDAKEAQVQSETKLRESRKGISLADEELEFLNEHIVPLIKKGISIPVACAAYHDQMPVSSRTIYSYIDRKVFALDNLELRLKVRRPLRKKSGPERRIDQRCRHGRTYDDYCEYMKHNPKAVVCQIDTVEGKKGGKVMLTVYFQDCGLQLLYIRERNDAASVAEIFNRLRNDLGEDFKNLFQVVLADRGTEFSNPQSIEYNTKTGERECRVFYCDPGNSNQKSECEKNHGIVRYIFPKGHSLDKYSQEKVSLAMNHINSYPREKWDIKTPTELFIESYGPQVARKLGLVEVEFRSLCLRPDLVK